MQTSRSLRKKIEKLEREKADLLAKIEKLRKVGEEKARALEEEVATLREEVESLKKLISIENESKLLIQEKREREQEIPEGHIPRVRCNDCARLTNELFCPILGSYLSPDTINKPWECDSFQKKKPQNKPRKQNCKHACNPNLMHAFLG